MRSKHVGAFLSVYTKVHKLVYKIQYTETVHDYQHKLNIGA